MNFSLTFFQERNRFIEIEGMSEKARIRYSVGSNAPRNFSKVAFPFSTLTSGIINKTIIEQIN